MATGGHEAASSENQKSYHQHSDGSRVIVDILGNLKRWSKGRHIESIVKRCEKENGWDREETMKALRAAKEQGLIQEATFNGNVRFRECQQDTPNITFRDKKRCVETQTTDNTIYDDVLNFKECI